MDRQAAGLANAPARGRGRGRGRQNLPPPPPPAMNQDEVILDAVPVSTRLPTSLQPEAPHVETSAAAAQRKRARVGGDESRIDDLTLDAPQGRTSARTPSRGVRIADDHSEDMSLAQRLSLQQARSEAFTLMKDVSRAKIHPEAWAKVVDESPPESKAQVIQDAFMLALRISKLSLFEDQEVNVHQQLDVLRSENNELKNAKVAMESTIDHMRTANEDLKSTNETLSSSTQLLNDQLSRATENSDKLSRDLQAAKEHTEKVEGDLASKTTEVESLKKRIEDLTKEVEDSNAARATAVENVMYNFVFTAWSRCNIPNDQLIQFGVAYDGQGEEWEEQGAPRTGPLTRERLEALARGEVDVAAQAEETIVDDNPAVDGETVPNDQEGQA